MHLFSMNSWRGWREWRLDLLLMAGVLALLVLRYLGIFATGPLPNWDAVGHFAALQRMTHYLASGHLTGYLREWYGGMPLFQFYPPLFFAAVAGAWYALGQLVPLALLFRLAALLAVFAAVPALWFFTATFFGRPAARWAVALSPLYLFSPIAVATGGLGASAALLIGLIPNAAGLALALAWPAVLERWHRAPQLRAWAVAAVALPTALALTHTLSLVFGVLLVAVWAALHLRDCRSIARVAAAGAVAVGLSAFWLVPFIFTSGLAVGEMRVVPLLQRVLMLFPLHVWLMQPVVAAELALASVGVVVAWRRRAFAVPALYLAALFLVLAHGLWAGTPAGLGIHFYRLAPLANLFQLTLAAAGLQAVWERCAGRARLPGYVLAATATLVLIAFFGMYAGTVASGEIIASSSVPMNQSDFPEMAGAEQAVAWLAAQPAVQRVSLDQPGVETIRRYGSLSYLATALADAGLASTDGLYLEAAPLRPDLSSVHAALAGSGSVTDETQHLRRLGPFMQQDPAVQLGRLRAAGVDYHLAMTKPLLERLVTLGVSVVWSANGLAIAHDAAAAPLASATAVLPGVFLSDYGHLSFRDVATALYAGERTYDFPVVEWRGVPSDLPNVADSFSFLMVDGTRLTETDRAELASFGLPVVELGGGHAALPGGAAIADFEPLRTNLRTTVTAWPTGWPELWATVEKLARPNPDAAAPAAATWPDERTMVVRGRGPVLLRYAYFPYWQAAADRALRVSPDFMLVFPDAGGAIRLEYRPDRVARVAQALSALSAAAAALWLVWPYLARLADRRRH